MFYVFLKIVLDFCFQMNIVFVKIKKKLQINKMRTHHEKIKFNKKDQGKNQKKRSLEKIQRGESQVEEKTKKARRPPLWIVPSVSGLKASTIMIESDAFFYAEFYS